MEYTTCRCGHEMVKHTTDSMAQRRQCLEAGCKCERYAREENATVNLIEREGASHDAIVKTAVDNYVAAVQFARKIFVRDMEAAWEVCRKQMTEAHTRMGFVARTFKEDKP